MIDERGKRNLNGVHPRLATAVFRAADTCPIDVTIIDGGGVRTSAQAKNNASRGTGVLNSLHLPQADSYGHAVDLLPLGVDGEPYWDVTAAKVINEHLFAAADADDFPLQNGADWDLDGIYGEKGEWDWHHTQIPRAYKLEAAEQAMARRKEGDREAGLSPWITKGLKPEDMRDADFDDSPGVGPEGWDL